MLSKYGKIVRLKRASHGIEIDCIWYQMKDLEKL